MRAKTCDSTRERLASRIAAACGNVPATLVIKNTQVLDVFSNEFFTGDVAFHDGLIVGTQESYEGKAVLDGSGLFVVPGFIDSHVHVESSMMTPIRFQESVLPLGTTTALWDPHEISNVLGAQGVQWALNSAEALFMDIFVLLPSCVPATHLETSGASLDAEALEAFRSHPQVLGLAEVMNLPGVLFGDKDLGQKLQNFAGTIRDGHAPMLSGKALNAYLCAGIQGCHESTSMAEAREKLRKGMHVLVREGSCAKNAHDLLPLINSATSATVALCSDDRNPADIRNEGHIDFIINTALAAGQDPAAIFRSASFAAARAYGLYDRGVVAPGYRGDAVLIKQRVPGKWAAGFEIVHVIKSGEIVCPVRLKRSADSFLQVARPQLPAGRKRNIQLGTLNIENLKVDISKVSAQDASKIKIVNEKISSLVIGIIPGQIITDKKSALLPLTDNKIVQCDLALDILKIAVLERHHASGKCGLGFVQGFGLKSGAIAASIGHDSHNLVTLGATDQCMWAAAQAVNDMDGGIAVVDANGKILASIALPIAGLMTDSKPEDVAQALLHLKAATKQLGCKLDEPFLQMSFLALPVIPALKITDFGLVDVNKFEVVSMFDLEN